MIKKSAQIADQIGEALIEMGWPLGQTVRTESELMAEYETSRAVVREALSLVEHRGIANVKTGRGGGLHVAYTRKEAAVNELSAYMELADCQRDDLVLMTGAMHAKVAEVALRECSDETASRLEALRAIHVGKHTCSTMGMQVVWRSVERMRAVACWETRSIV